MINFKKGPAMTLRQVNYLAKAVSGEAIEAGHVVRLVDNSGVIEARKGATNATAPTNVLYGFAIQNQDSGDVLESGVLGVYALDGQSVIETDKVAGTINSATYALGALLSVDTAGLVCVTPNATSKVIGQVEGIRTLPGRVQTVGGVKIQGTVTVLGIKLAN